MFVAPTVAAAVLADLSKCLALTPYAKVRRGTKRVRCYAGDDYRAFRKRVQKRRAKKGYR